jgi:threonine/homoserine/homoserine lactone efflux protein
MLWSFVLAAILIELTPGPNMTWLAVLGATRGRTVALAAVAGICFGLAIAGAIAAIGLTALLTQWPILFAGLRWGGTLYLFYLAWDAWCASEDLQSTFDEGALRAFQQGLVSNILNPKAYLFYAAMLPQFVSGAVAVKFEIAILTATYVAIATVIHAVIALLSGSLADFLKSSSKAVIIRKSLAVAIAAAAIWFFYSTKVTQ